MGQSPIYKYLAVARNFARIIARARDNVKKIDYFPKKSMYSISKYIPNVLFYTKNNYYYVYKI